MAKQDGLFLLEVLVDKVTFDKAPCFSNQDFRTCVTIECPSVPPLEICDDDPGVPHNSGSFNKAFNSGKSCLFSMKEDAIIKCMTKFPVRVQVIKSLPCGCIPTKIIMGMVEIDMTKEFIETRNKFLEDPTAISFQALRDKFHLIGADGIHSGEISMYLRISCFGSQIVTKFRKADGQIIIGKPDQDGRFDRSCDAGRTYQTPQDPCACGASRSGVKDGPITAEEAKGICPNTRLGTAICPHAKDEYNNTPCEVPDDPCYCCGARPIPKDPMACRNTDPYCLHIPKDCCPPGNKVVFQIPSDTCAQNHKQRMHFNFTSDGVGDVMREDPENLAKPEQDNYPGVVYDMGKQVIKLRVGKKCEIGGRKSKLEYQFITPVPTAPQIRVTEQRTAQCDPTPCRPCCSCRRDKK